MFGESRFSSKPLARTRGITIPGKYFPKFVQFVRHGISTTFEALPSQSRVARQALSNLIALPPKLRTSIQTSRFCRTFVELNSQELRAQTRFLALTNVVFIVILIYNLHSLLSIIISLEQNNTAGWAEYLKAGVIIFFVYIINFYLSLLIPPAPSSFIPLGFESKEGSKLFLSTCPMTHVSDVRKFAEHPP